MRAHNEAIPCVGECYNEGVVIMAGEKVNTFEIVVHVLSSLVWPRWRTQWWVMGNLVFFPPRAKLVLPLRPTASQLPARFYHPLQLSPAIIRLKLTAPKRKRWPVATGPTRHKPPFVPQCPVSFPAFLISTFCFRNIRSRRERSMKWRQPSNHITKRRKSQRRSTRRLSVKRLKR